MQHSGVPRVGTTQPLRTALRSLPMTTPARARSWWGWGWADLTLSDDQCARWAATIPGLPDTPLPVPSLDDLHLPALRVAPPATLAAITTTAPGQRAVPGASVELPQAVAVEGRLGRGPADEEESTKEPGGSVLDELMEGLAENSLVNPGGDK